MASGKERRRRQDVASEAVDRPIRERQHHEWATRRRARAVIGPCHTRPHGRAGDPAADEALESRSRPSRMPPDASMAMCIGRRCSARGPRPWTERACASLADGLLYLKAEHLQKTGSFKARGMTNRIATLPEGARARGPRSRPGTRVKPMRGRAHAGVPMTVVMRRGVRSKVEASSGTARGYARRARG